MDASVSIQHAEAILCVAWTFLLEESCQTGLFGTPHRQWLFNRALSCHLLLYLPLNAPMCCRRLYTAEACGTQRAWAPFKARELSTMTRLTELRVTADLDHHYDDDDPPQSLEELTMLQKLTIDYQHMHSWMEPVPIIVSDAAKLTELCIRVHRKVSKNPRVSLFCC